jgi:ribonuclease HI
MTVRNGKAVKDDKVRIFTDGACSGNPGPGGWGGILLMKGGLVTIGGYEKHTTNNRMELLAVIKSIQKAVSKGYSNIEIHSDSAYVVNSVDKHWLVNWKKNNWKTGKGEDVKNKDLWVLLDTMLSDRSKTIKLIKVKGHDGITFNEMADKEAVRNVARAKEALYNEEHF